MKKKELSTKRMAFVHEYLQCWNASEAARRAGYSDKTAYSSGSFLLKIPEVLAKIEEYQREKSMGVEEVLARLADQARASFAPFIRVSEDGVVDFDLSSPEAQDNFHLVRKFRLKRRRLVEGQEKDAHPWEYEWIDIELHDAQTALIALGRHLKLFADKFPATQTIEFVGLEPTLDKVYGKPKDPSKD